MLTHEEVTIALENAYDSLHSVSGISSELDIVVYECMDKISKILISYPLTQHERQLTIAS